MRISPEALAAESEATGFGAHMLEKSVRLLALLDAIRDHPLLDRKLALKGGTALNLFVFRIPRLSVDIDLNYVGTASRDVMLKERPAVERAIRTVCGRENLTVRRVPPNMPAVSGRSGTHRRTARAEGSKWISISCTAYHCGRSPR